MKAQLRNCNRPYQQSVQLINNQFSEYLISSIFFQCIVGFLGCIWYIVWECAIYDSPSLHPTITENERIFITRTIAEKEFDPLVRYFVQKINTVRYFVWRPYTFFSTERDERIRTDVLCRKYTHCSKAFIGGEHRNESEFHRRAVLNRNSLHC